MSVLRMLAMVAAAPVVLAVPQQTGAPAAPEGYSRVQYVGCARRNSEHAQNAPLTSHPPAACTCSAHTASALRSFPIQTGYDGYLGSNMFYIDEEDGVGVYPGYDDSKADIAGRIAVMERAIEASLEAPDLDTSNDTLKIFLAPEFFFRGPVGAYSADDPALLELGDSLRSMVANTKWQDWVFVFGSIIGSNKMAPEKKTNLTGGPLWDTYNFAIVQRGNSPERHTHFKRYISGIDFLVSVPDHPGALLSDARSCHMRASQRSHRPAKCAAIRRHRLEHVAVVITVGRWVISNRAGAIVYPNMNLNSPDLNTTEIIDNITVPVPKSKDEIHMLYPEFPPAQLPALEQAMGSVVNGSFSMAGLDFCLDLCLDHARGVCASALDAEKAAGGRGQVDVQLIVSAGMSIIPDNTRVPIGGSVMLCDGLGSGAQHLVSKFGDTLLGGNVHVATAAEARALPKAELEQHLIADNTIAAGQLGAAVNISIYGDHWRAPVLGLFGAQRYKPRTQGHGHYSSPPPPPPPAEKIEENFLDGVAPSDWVFPSIPLPSASCKMLAAQLCGTTAQRGNALDCESCAGKHMIELVAAGCTDAAVVSFCSTI